MTKAKKAAGEPKLYTLQEIADILRMNRATLYSHIRRGHISFKKYGRAYRATEEDLQQLIRDGFGADK